MPAVSKGEGMRGLAVFISDIRNCECQTPGGPERGRGWGSAGAAGGLGVRPERGGGYGPVRGSAQAWEGGLRGADRTVGRGSRAGA